MGKLIFVAALAAAMASAGCPRGTSSPHTAPAPATSAPPPPGMVRVTGLHSPGDAALPPPSLRLVGDGGAEIEYAGRKKVLSLGIEIWEAGKRVSGPTWHAQELLGNPARLTWSLSDTDDGSEIMISQSSNGSSTSPAPLRIRSKRPAGASLSSLTTGDLTYGEDDEIDLWIAESGSGGASVREPVQDVARRSTWALVLKAALDDTFETAARRRGALGDLANRRDRVRFLEDAHDLGRREET